MLKVRTTANKKEHYCEGIPLEDYIKAIKNKRSTKISKIVNRIQEGETVDDIYKTDPEIIYSDKKKLKEFESYVRLKEKKIKLNDPNRQRKFQRIDESQFSNCSSLALSGHDVIGKYKISQWYNFRLVDGKPHQRPFHKRWSGLYLHTPFKLKGTDEFIKLLGQIDNAYFWEKQNNGYHPNWDQSVNYSIIVFNATSNSKNIPFDIIETLGNNSNVTIKKKRNEESDSIIAGTPYIFTSNVSPEKLNYSNKLDMAVLTERMLVIDLENEDLFDLIKVLIELHKLEDKYLIEDPLPEDRFNESPVQDDPLPEDKFEPLMVAEKQFELDITEKVHDTYLDNSQSISSFDNDNLSYNIDITENAEYQSREEECRVIFQGYFAVLFPSIRHSDIINPKTGELLELDGYNEQLKIAFEYNGYQHYKFPNIYHKSKKEFDDQLERDQFKAKRCKELDITLIIIPYKERYNLYNFITKILKSLSIKNIEN